MKCGALALSVALAAVLTTACTRAQAKVKPEDPALEVPPPPGRVIAAISPEVPQPVGAPDGVPSAGIDELRRTETPKPPVGTAPRVVRPPETKPDSPDVVDPPRPSEEPRPGTSPLTTTTTQRESEVEGGIRADVQRARNNLDRVNYQRLSSDAQTQYDLAKGWLLQVEEYLRARNFPLAKTLAEKAVALAAQLGR